MRRGGWWCGVGRGGMVGGWGWYDGAWGGWGLWLWWRRKGPRCWMLDEGCSRSVKELKGIGGGYFDLIWWEGGCLRD